MKRSRSERHVKSGLNRAGPLADQARTGRTRTCRPQLDWVSIEPSAAEPNPIEPKGAVKSGRSESLEKQPSREACQTTICAPLRPAIHFGQPNGALRAALVGPPQRPAIRNGRQARRLPSRCAAGARAPIFAMSRADRPLGDRIVPTAKGILWQRMRGASAPGRFSSCLR